MEVSEQESIFGDPLYWQDEVVWQLLSVPQLRPQLLKVGAEVLVDGVRAGLGLAVRDVHTQLLLMLDEGLAQVGGVRLTLQQLREKFAEEQNTYVREQAKLAM